MNPTVIFWQAVVVGMLLTGLRGLGERWLSVAIAIGVIAVAGLVRLCSHSALRRLPPQIRGAGSEEILGSVLAIALMPFLLDARSTVGSTGPQHLAAARPGFIELSDSDVPLAMVLIAAIVAAVIYLSSLIDWFYVRAHLLGSAGPICRTSSGSPWRLVTRVRLTHRLAAVLGFVAGLTALVGLAASHWVRPFDDVVAGAVGAVATIVAGYYLTRAAPLVAMATNPSILICDVVRLAEEFNVPDDLRNKRYFVLDIGWEGIKLREVASTSIPPVGIGDRGALARDDRQPPPYDRMIDIGDVSKLLRRREALAICGRGCRRWTGGCAIGPSRADGTPNGARDA